MTSDIISTANPALRSAVQARLDDLTKPPGSLGRLEEFVLRFCLCHDSADARLERTAVRVFAADHGITAEGVAPYPREVTQQMVLNMLAGGAAVTVMCDQAGTDYRVVDMGVDAAFEPHERLISHKIAPGTRGFLRECAMSPEQCTRALAAGEAVASDLAADIVGIGEMGIGNTSAASALTALLLGIDGKETVGRGTGADDTLLERKRDIIDRAVDFHRGQWNGSPTDALRRVGGFEIAGMTGFVLGCARTRTPVVVDGFIATAAALCATRMHPAVSDYLFFGHVSHEQYHRRMLQEMKARPILDLDMRLGEGTGAVVAMQVIAQALNCYHHMATFSSAGVSNRDG